MKTTLYYFTGTGNSLWAARELANHIPDTTLVPMARLMHEGGEIVAPKGRIGFIFPVYIGGPPLLVAEFAKKIDLTAADEIFSLVTMGMAGDGAWKQLNKILKKRSFPMNAAYSVKLPTNYMVLQEILPEEKKTNVIATAQSDIERIAGKITRGEKGFEKGPFLINFFNNALYPLVKGQLRAQGARFWVDDNCNNCGICEQICPVHNITINAINSPEWGNACESCFACINYCPQSAIQSGKKTASRGRYHHPDVSIKDLMVQNGRE